MVEPTKISEINIQNEEFRKTLDIRLDNLKQGLQTQITDKIAGLDGRLGDLRTLFYVVIGMITTVLLGVLGTYGYVYSVQEKVLAQIGELKKDVAVVQTKVAATEAAVAEVKKAIEQSRAEARDFFNIVTTRLGGSPPPVPPQRIASDSLDLTSDDGQLIRAFINTDPIKTPIPGKIRIGDTLPLAIAKELPGDLVGKLPKLKGLRYVIDSANNLIALVNESGRVLALV
jgi:hypothetical protein